jgi:hypothetical protein
VPSAPAHADVRPVARPTAPGGTVGLGRSARRPCPAARPQPPHRPGHWPTAEPCPAFECEGSRPGGSHPPVRPSPSGRPERFNWWGNERRQNGIVPLVAPHPALGAVCGEVPGVEVTPRPYRVVERPLLVGGQPAILRRPDGVAPLLRFVRQQTQNSPPALFQVLERPTLVAHRGRARHPQATPQRGDPRGCPPPIRGADRPQRRVVSRRRLPARRAGWRVAGTGGGRRP